MRELKEFGESCTYIYVKCKCPRCGYISEREICIPSELTANKIRKESNECDCVGCGKIFKVKIAIAMEVEK